VERCSKSRLEGEWVERLLERVCALYSTSVPGERNGIGCIRGRHAYIAGVA